MSATFEEIREGVITFISAAMGEEQDSLMKAIDMMNEKGLKLSFNTVILPSDDSTVNEIQVKLTFVPEKIQVKTEGFTERLKNALTKIKG
jgi:hypothetical protein